MVFINFNIVTDYDAPNIIDNIFVNLYDRKGFKRFTAPEDGSDFSQVTRELTTIVTVVSLTQICRITPLYRFSRIFQGD